MSKAHLIVIYGLSRSGKDTLIEAIQGEWNKGVRLPRAVPIVSISSITQVRNFLHEVEMVLGLKQVERTSAEYRQTLATIKGAIDKLFDYTVANAKTCLIQAITSDQPSVMVYQVRELDNIHKLAVMCEENKIEMTSIMVTRAETKDAAKDVAASSERYPASAYAYADIVVRNDGSIDQLRKWAQFIVEQVEQTFAQP